jgi:phosphomannomutase / phosphoglucomutase
MRKIRAGNPMKIPRHTFREYDIRGVADRDLSDDLMAAIGRGFAAMIRAGRSGGNGGEPTRRDGMVAPRIAVGRDGRLSSDRIFHALTAGLREGGANVIAIGVGPTPMLYFAAHHLDTDGAMMITGSHNPAPDNGVKMMRGKRSFYGQDIQELGNLLERDDFGSPGGSDPLQGSLTEQNLELAYIDAIRSASRIAHTRIRFVVDAGNGAAGPLGLATLRALGFSPDPLFCEMDGRFPNHHPDPTVPANLEALRHRVLETGAELGLAWDGDGDRLGAMDHTGAIVWGDKLLLLFARALLLDNPGAAIIGEVKCSETLYADIAARGGRPIIWKTGHSLIKTKMKEEGALLAGEMSGHLFFADRYFGYDDAIYAAIRLLEIIARQRCSLRDLLADVPETFVTPEIRVDCPEAIKFRVVARVLEHYRATHKVLDIDGARIDFTGGAWGLCRASNTQAVLVLRFEADTEARRDAIRSEVEAVVAGAVLAEGMA